MLVSLDPRGVEGQAQRHTLSAGKKPYPRDEPITFEPESVSGSFDPTHGQRWLPGGPRDGPRGERGQGKQQKAEDGGVR